MRWQIRRYRPRRLLFWAFVSICAAQTADPPGMLLFTQIGERMEQNLEQQPNLTCLQTIERSARGRGANRFKAVDTLRLEVAFIGSKELYAWPDAEAFEEKELSEMIGEGVVSTGSFALHAQALFISQAPTIRYKGEEIRQGRRTVRYEYDFPVSFSDYRIRRGDKAARVPYHGVFWADPETLDLVRIEAVVDKIPDGLGLAEVLTEVEYARVQMGKEAYLLPQSAASHMTFASGEVRLNRTTFSQCRQFTADATLSFAEAAEPALEKDGEAAGALPAGLLIPVRLETPIDSATTGLGDTITATVTSDVRSKGKVAVPKGALLTGRIRALAKEETAYAYFTVGLEFFRVEFDGKQAPFSAQLEEIGPRAGVSRTARPPARGRTKPGVGMFHVQGSRFRLGEGLRMLWRTTRLTP